MSQRRWDHALHHCTTAGPFIFECLWFWLIGESLESKREWLQHGKSRNKSMEEVQYMQLLSHGSCHAGFPEPKWLWGRYPRAKPWPVDLMKWTGPSLTSQATVFDSAPVKVTIWSLVPRVKFSSSKPRPVAAGDFDVFFERGFFRASQVAMTDFICILKNRHA